MDYEEKIKRLEYEIKQLSEVDDYQRERIFALKKEIKWRDESIERYKMMLDNAFRLYDIMRQQGEIDNEINKIRNGN